MNQTKYYDKDGNEHQDPTTRFVHYRGEPGFRVIGPNECQRPSNVEDYCTVKDVPNHAVPVPSPYFDFIVQGGPVFTGNLDVDILEAILNFAASHGYNYEADGFNESQRYDGGKIRSLLNASAHNYLNTYIAPPNSAFGFNNRGHWGLWLKEEILTDEEIEQATRTGRPKA